MRYIVMFSGGIGSWGAARRVAEQYGTAEMTLLFTDTGIEDEDLYRFLDEAAANIGAPLVRIADGRTPWQVFFEMRFLGNSRIDPCSKILKRQMADRWLREHCDPAETVIYLGIDWTEAHRFDDGKGRGAKYRYAKNGWCCEAPLCTPPYLTKSDLLGILTVEGITKPHLYQLGFAHNNCGGFCVKAGQGHFLNLLRTMPDRYALHEAEEEKFRHFLDKDVAILSESRAGQGKRPLTLRALRQRAEAGGQIDLYEIGGCGCFLDDDQEAA
jgi:hypothetical protein